MSNWDWRDAGIFPEEGFEPSPWQKPECPVCRDEGVVSVGPPDEFGNVDFDDCDCVKP